MYRIDTKAGGLNYIRSGISDFHWPKEELDQVFQEGSGRGSIARPGVSRGSLTFMTTLLSKSKSQVKYYHC